ncbi:MAG: segregation and condensation protein segregation and condensation protein [Candidatus Parcubacteria bacterium]|jgi:segregation and condensation protein B
MELSLQSQLESLLFWKGEPVSLAELAKLTGSTPADCSVALEALQQHLASEARGIVLVVAGDTYELATAPAMATKIAALTREELTKDLSKAALETLSIVLYRGPIRRSEIDYIRGVNSQFILRMLAIRGLVVRTSDPHDERAFTYGPSIELLKLLGVESAASLPDFAQVNADIEGFIAAQRGEEKQTPTDAVTETNAHGSDQPAA